MIRFCSISLAVVLCMLVMAPNVIAQPAGGSPGISQQQSTTSQNAPQMQSQQQSAPQQKAPQMQQQPQPPKTPSVEASDAEIEKVAKAYMEINKVQQSLQKELESANDAKEAQKMQQSAAKRMAMAVSKVGIEVDRYNQIMQAAQFDENLKQRIFETLSQSDQ
ncbi:MAG: DUF4168 domain-containing protein [Candidatus Rifleibacteriota bacterium]